MTMTAAGGKMARDIGSFILAVLASGLAATVVGSFWVFRDEGVFRADVLPGLWFMVTCVAAFCAFIFGLPIFAFLASRTWENALCYIAAGFIVGLVPGYVMSLAFKGTDSLFVCLSCGIPGAVCGLTWWWLARR